MTKYQEYQLKWMIEHNCSIDDLIENLDTLAKDMEPETPIREVFDEWEKNQGFLGSIWACEEEWDDNEGDTFTETDLRKFGYEQMGKQSNNTDPDALIWFEHYDQEIVNPFMDPTGRFELNTQQAIATYGEKNVREWCKKARKAMKGKE